MLMDVMFDTDALLIDAAADQPAYKLGTPL